MTSLAISAEVSRSCRPDTSPKFWVTDFFPGAVPPCSLCLPFACASSNGSSVRRPNWSVRMVRAGRQDGITSPCIGNGPSPSGTRMAIPDGTPRSLQVAP